MKNFDILHYITLSNGETLAYRSCGSGLKTLLLIHGNMTSSLHFDLLSTELETNYKIYAIDMRGFGSSTYHTHIFSLDQLAMDILEFTNKLNLNELNLVGWSAGGGVALKLASLAPRKVDSIILIASMGVHGPLGSNKNMNEQLLSFALLTQNAFKLDNFQIPNLSTKELYRQFWNAKVYDKNKPNDVLYDKYLDDMLTQRNLMDIYYAISTFNMLSPINLYDWWSSPLSRFKTPTLILHGDRDHVIHIDTAYETKKLLKNVRLVELSDCGHSPFIDCLDQIVLEIKQFLNCV